MLELLKKYKWVIFLIISIIIGTVFYRLGVDSVETSDSIIQVEEIRDTVFYRDTIFIERPTPIYIKLIDSIPYYINDTVFINLPKEQACYEDTLYQAWISGVFPSLDSIKIFKEKMETTHIIKTVETIYVKQPRFGLAIYGGMGVQYGILGRNFDFGPQIGFGFYYILNKK